MVSICFSSIIQSLSLSILETDSRRRGQLVLISFIYISRGLLHILVSILFLFLITISLQSNLCQYIFYTLNVYLSVFHFTGLSPHFRQNSFPLFRCRKICRLRVLVVLLSNFKAEALASEPVSALQGMKLLVKWAHSVNSYLKVYVSTWCRGGLGNDVTYYRRA